MPGHDTQIGEAMTDDPAQPLPLEELRKAALEARRRVYQDGSFLVTTNFGSGYMPLKRLCTPDNILALLDRIARLEYGAELDAKDRSDKNDCITHWMERAKASEKRAGIYKRFAEDMNQAWYLDPNGEFAIDKDRFNRAFGDLDFSLAPSPSEAKQEGTL
jgi:hypothetical protein